MIVVSPLGFQVKVSVRPIDQARRFVRDLGLQFEMVTVPVKVLLTLEH